MKTTAFLALALTLANAQEAEPECLEPKSYPDEDGGLVSTGAIWLVEDNSVMPSECGAPYWDGNVHPYKVSANFSSKDFPIGLSYYFYL
jgi:hypothetical protein